jgi:tetratricopeptide (TPR) repeat protein
MVEELLRQAVGADPNSPLAYIELGKHLAAQGEREEAQLLYGQALGLDPSDVSLLVMLAENAAVLGDTPGAIDYWQEVALRNERRRGVAYYQIGNLAFADGNLSSALAFFKRAVEIEPENGRFLLGLAGAYVEVGCRREAIAVYQSVLETAEAAALLEEAQLKLAELAVVNDELSPCLDV